MDTKFTWLDSIKKISAGIVVLLFLSGDNNRRKEMLWEEFGWAHMQALPISKAAYKRVNDFDVVYQQAGLDGQDIQYTDSYIIGIFKPAGNSPKRVHLLSRVDPFKEYDLVKTLSDAYQTDTTYLDVLVRNRRNELESLVYRKVKPSKMVEQDMEYIMWKKEKVLLKNERLTTRLIEQWNKHMFE